jgi:hypothetical protein
MARAIVRFSLDAEYGATNRQRVEPRLMEQGFKSIGTGSYEGVNDMGSLLDGLIEAIEVLSDLKGNATLDHLWIYVDATHS